jgi:hypothetical protein
MELPGEENRIQALFCELRLEDQLLAPGFEKIWHCAQAKRPKERLALNRLVVLITSAMIVAAFCLLLLRSPTGLGEPRDEVGGLRETVSSTSVPVNRQDRVADAGPSRPVQSKSLQRKKLPVRRKTELAARVFPESVALSNWRSPTTRFMEHPSGPVLNSLPQMNESVRDFQSFLASNQ